MINEMAPVGPRGRTMAAGHARREPVRATSATPAVLGTADLGIG
jgi:hypothetical protein